MGVPTMHPLFYIPFALLPVLWAWKIKKRKARTKGLSLPPGPKRWPIVGNLFNLPSGKTWLVFDKLFKQYGDIISFELLGQSIVVLGSTKRTNEVFGKRSTIYSGRQASPFVLDVIDLKFNFFSLGFGTWWRRHRRTFHDHFSPNVVHRYHPNLLKAAHVLLRNLLTTPEAFFRHLRFMSAAAILDVTFDLQIEGLSNPYVINAEEVMKGFSKGIVFGSFWVDYAPFMIPFMKYVPSWVPGAGYKKEADGWRAAGRFMEYNAYERVKSDLANGIGHSCVASRLLASLPDDARERAEAEAIIRSVTATAYFAGADSTLSAIINFFAAMVKYPEVQKKGHEEIDRVVGPNRLPDFTDQDSLPYVAAIVKEALRWHLVANNVPHESTEDDEYDGYFIPKGTIVVGNSWSILHDPEVYSDPEEFRPERFLDDGINPPAPYPEAAFGYGRRTCPGRYFSDKELFITVSSVLAALDISRPVDKSGNPVDIALEHYNGFVSFPLPFECTIKPRSPKAEALIRATEELNYVA